MQKRAEPHWNYMAETCAQSTPYVRHWIPSNILQLAPTKRMRLIDKDTLENADNCVNAHAYSSAMNNWNQFLISTLLNTYSVIGHCPSTDSVPSFSTSTTKWALSGTLSGTPPPVASASTTGAVLSCKYTINTTKITTKINGTLVAMSTRGCDGPWFISSSRTMPISSFEALESTDAEINSDEIVLSNWFRFDRE